MRCHAACTIFSRCRAMPPRRRPPEQPAPTTSTRTFGQPRHSSSSSPRSRSPAHLDITQHRRTAQHSPADATCRATRSSCLTSHAPRKPEPSTTYPRPGSHTARRFPARRRRTGCNHQSSLTAARLLPPTNHHLLPCFLNKHVKSRNPPKTSLPSRRKPSRVIRGGL